MTQPASNQTLQKRNAAAEPPLPPDNCRLCIYWIFTYCIKRAVTPSEFKKIRYSFIWCPLRDDTSCFTFRGNLELLEETLKKRMR